MTEGPGRTTVGTDKGKTLPQNNTVDWAFRDTE